MRKALVVAVLSVMMAGMDGDLFRRVEGGLFASEFVIEVSCPDPEGCFSLLAKAIKQAPAGATLRIGPGIYYEKSLTIEKSLKIEGIPTETSHYPRLVLVEAGTAILIRASQTMEVELHRLSIEALAQDPSTGNSVGVGLFVQTSESVRVMLKEVSIRSHQGMGIAGDQPGELTVEAIDADIFTSLLGIEMNMGHLILHRSKLLAPKISLLVPLHGIFLQPSPSLQIKISLNESLIEGFSIGLMAVASSQLGQGRIDLKGVENVIASNRQDGLYLLGDRVDVELNQNELRGNGGYGIKLALPACAPEGTRQELRFQGVVRGAENEFFNNKSGNLCPPDYPWPPNFQKQP